MSIFKGILFIKRNIIWIGLLFIAGVGLGIYFDKTTKVYDNELIVNPNFGSTDYLYSRIELLNAKIKEDDTIFLKEVVGIKNPSKLTEIEIEPITDIYKFINNSPTNFEFIKLMAEDGELSKILKDNMTSKNYPFHMISFTTANVTNDEGVKTPLLNYLNKSGYFTQVQKEWTNNVKVKMSENDTIISQINGFLKGFSSTVNGSQKSDKLVYYNENSQLNEVIKTKDALIAEQGVHRLELVNLDKIIKEISSTTNIKNIKGVNGKLKFLLPILFIFLFIIGGLFRSYYKNQMAKLNS